MLGMFIYYLYSYLSKCEEETHIHYNVPEQNMTLSNCCFYLTNSLKIQICSIYNTVMIRGGKPPILIFEKLETANVCPLSLMNALKIIRPMFVDQLMISAIL